MVHLGFKVNFWLIWHKKTLWIAEMLNISNLSFPKKAKICGGKQAHRLYGFILNLILLAKTIFTYVYSYLLLDKFLREARGMCIQFRIDGAQNLSRMCMCIEFVIQVLKVKQKDAHVSLPVGMVALSSNDSASFLVPFCLSLLPAPFCLPPRAFAAMWDSGED